METESPKSGSLFESSVGLMQNTAGQGLYAFPAVAREVGFQIPGPRVGH